jgi:hypothetical protein
MSLHIEAREQQLEVRKMSDLARSRLTVRCILKIKTNQGMWNDSTYFRDLKIKQYTVYCLTVTLISVLKYT